MNVAITVWKNRVSPVFDSSHMLLIVEIENACVRNRTYMTFNPEMPSYLIENLNRIGVSTLICGAVSEIPASMIDASGIELIPFVAGYVEKVLESFAKDDSIPPDFIMPGCDRKPYRKGRMRSNQRSRATGGAFMPNKDGTGPRAQGQLRGKGKKQDRMNRGKGGMQKSRRGAAANTGGQGRGLRSR